jgi:predicted site-specific integrase-resolvase
MLALNIVPPPRLQGSMRTNEFLSHAGISEATLRRWLRQGQPIPELLKAERDWTGKRIWTKDHVRLVLEYKTSKKKQYD